MRTFNCDTFNDLFKNMIIFKERSIIVSLNIYFKANEKFKARNNNFLKILLISCALIIWFCVLTFQYVACIALRSVAHRIGESIFDFDLG